MMKILKNHFRIALKLVVLIGFSCAHAGSYEDFFKFIKRDEPGIIQQLLVRGFDANTPDPYGQLGLIMAFEEPSPKVIQTLIDWPKTNLNTLNSKGESPLMMAALKGEAGFAEQMIKKGADVNKTGWTPLHYAATGGDVKVISLLLANHAYIDAESPNGTTPLMMACRYGSTESVKLLLDEGADPTLKNKLGATALQFALDGIRPDAIAMMTKAARAQAPRSNGQW
ncbi:MAG: ankyrin repeat domain-containing protein [Pseudomonadota bacterium]